MLALVFEVNGECYGVPASRVMSVVRRPRVRAVPAAPAWIAGLFSWNDAWVPLVDLSLLIARTPCPEGAATRVALVERRYEGRVRVLGLLAPGMTRVADLGSAQGAPGLSIEGQDFLGAVVDHEELGVQLLEIDRVVPPEIDALLFREAAHALESA